MFRKIGFIIGLAVWGIGMSSCGYRSICEAQITVKQADSLWRAGQMYGREAGDSTTLAQAYETLGRLSPFIFHLSSSYAHACYHYGRLLRERENPAAAMECFINATHTRTRDYHILGRVYSNMGSMCHLVGEFPLSYEMYAQSAKMYLLIKDTLLYYYDLNNMAYEKAMQADKAATFSLIEQIENSCADDNVLYKTKETTAELYVRCQQYDSAIYYAKEWNHGYDNPSLALIVAQSYSYIGNKDSATLYANIVLSQTNELYEQNNALYILTNDDESKDKHAIREFAADRADTQKLIEIRKTKLSQAVQLLEQDLHRKPPRRWVYTLIAIILTLCSACIMYFTHRKHKLLLQQHSDYSQKRKADLEISCAALRNSYNLKKEMNWDKYDSMCSIVNVRLGGIAEKLKTFPDITPNDVRLCVLVLLELTYEDTALMLNLSSKSIAKLKSITAHKLGTTMKNLHDKLIQIACSDKEK